MHAVSRLCAAFGVLALVMLAGCATSPGDAVPDKAGGEGGPITLRLGTPDQRGRPASEHLEFFASDVEQRSEGALQVEIVWEAQGPGGVPRFDRAVAEQVRSAALDMGLIPARAWDALGVTSFQALQAPFLVTSNELVDEIVASDLQTELLSGLHSQGLTGLALWPEGLRHPVGFQQALLSPADFQGRQIRAPYSEATTALLEALGADAVDLAGEELERAIREGHVVGAESATELLASLGLPINVTATVTGNVTFFPKINVLVVRTDVLDRLSHGQRATLQDAAESTRAHAIETRPDSDEIVAEACRGGATVVLASDAQLRSFEDATQGLYAELEQDPRTKALIESIQTLKDSVPMAEDVTPCTPPAAIGPSPVPTGFGGLTIPNGLYRKEVTIADYLAAGVGRVDAENNSGIFDFGLMDGRFTLTDPRSPVGGCPGSYTVSGSIVTFTLDPVAGCGGSSILFTAQWALEEGGLTFTGFPPADAFGNTLFGDKPWVKID